ncbi:MAG: hypothetical protein WAP55_00015 [Minisyncoccia bacterium]
MSKYPQWTGQLEYASVEIAYAAGRVEALVNTLGELDGELVADSLISGDLRAEVVDGQVVIRPVEPLLFGRHGRRIPPRGLVANVCDPNRNFHLVQPTIDYAKRLYRLAESFSPGTNLLSYVAFETKCRALLEQIKADRQLANLLKGVHLPVCLPHLEVVDYGQALEEIFIPSVGRAYTLHLAKPFTNYRQGELQGQVEIVDSSRHDRLLARMAEEAVAGIYFPNPLQGYSVHAQREQMATLPESFLLAGGLDTAAAWVMYPDVLARDGKTPGYNCSAVQWLSPGLSLYFKARGGDAHFGLEGNLAGACDFYSGGLLFLG